MNGEMKAREVQRGNIVTPEPVRGKLANKGIQGD